MRVKLKISLKKTRELNLISNIMIKEKLQSFPAVIEQIKNIDKSQKNTLKFILLDKQ